MPAHDDGGGDGPQRVAASEKSLARQLGLSHTELVSLAARVGQHYSGWDVLQPPKTPGKQAKCRHLDLPSEDLARVQRRVRIRILRHCELPPEIYGYRAGATTRYNARRHVNQRQVLSLDLRDCFPRISHKSVYAALRRELGCTPDVARLLTQLTTLHGRLPQGTSTSPDLANIALAAMYRDLSKQAQQAGLVATYWADDITVSGSNVRPHVSGLIRTIQLHGHAVRNRKVKIVTCGNRQLVTGLAVNRRLSIPRAYYEAVRSDIIRTSYEPSMTRALRSSLEGRIRYVSQQTPELGRILATLAANRLPPVSSPGVRAKPSWIDCDGRRCKAV